jgi:ABC-type nickel/cobalt efflux system permease component RcnA
VTTIGDQAKERAMGMWIELGIFVLVLAFGLWQIHDVGQERRKREAQKQEVDVPPHSAKGDAPN